MRWICADRVVGDPTGPPAATSAFWSARCAHAGACTTFTQRRVRLVEDGWL